MSFKQYPQPKIHIASKQQMTVSHTLTADSLLKKKHLNKHKEVNDISKKTTQQGHICFIAVNWITSLKGGPLGMQT